MSTTVTKTRPRVLSIAGLLLKLLLAGLFLAAAGLKIYGLPSMVNEFSLVGWGQWFRYFTAIVEIIGVILLLAPRTTAFGAIVLGAVCCGAFFAQLLVIHNNVPHTVVLAAILGAIAWVHKEQIYSGFSR
jgi:putative oxidoreductase